MISKAELQDRVAALEAEKDALIAEHELFKIKVVKVATSYAKKYNWCGVVDRALRAMGLGDRLPPHHEVQVKNGRGWQSYNDEANAKSAILSAKQRTAGSGRKFRAVTRRGTKVTVLWPVK
jgi:hypothetical protein